LELQPRLTAKTDSIGDMAMSWCSDSSSTPEKAFFEIIVRPSMSVSIATGSGSERKKKFDKGGVKAKDKLYPR
jgi:hypothetical protein